MSWVANLFSTSQPPHLAPNSSHHNSVFAYPQPYQDDHKRIEHQGRIPEFAQPMDEEEEAARSPYWHVSNSISEKVMLLMRLAKTLRSVC